MAKLHTYDMPEDHCLSCGMLIEAATNIQSAHKPDPGDLTVCWNCGHLMAFDEQLRMRALTDAEIKQAAGDRRLLMIQKARALIKD